MNRRTPGGTTGRTGSNPDAVSISIPAWPIDVARMRLDAIPDAVAAVANGLPVQAMGGLQATGGSVNCWPARETCSVHCEPSQ